MITLIMDRLAMDLLSIKYQVIMTRRRMKIGLAVCWILGVICGVVFVSLNDRQISIVIYTSADCSFLTVTVATYTSLMCSIRKRRKSLQTNTNTDVLRVKSYGQGIPKFYLVTGLIILSFTMFVAIPNIFSSFIFDLESFGEVVGQIMWSLNNLIDPCVYIFLQKTARILLRRKLMAWRITKKNQRAPRENYAKTTV